MQWRLAAAAGDGRALDSIRTRFDAMSSANLRRILGLAQVEGVHRMSSTASTGSGTVSLELELGSSMDAAMADAALPALREVLALPAQTQ